MARVANPRGYYGFRKLILERDGYKCVQCGATESLEVDHIKSFTHYPELRYEPSNGRTLCRPCHKKTDTYGAKSKRRSGRSDW